MALEFARSQAHDLEQVWVLDSDPGVQVVTDEHEVTRVMQAARAMPEPIASRQSVVNHLKAEGLSAGIANWLTGHIRREEGQLRWTLDFDAIGELMGDYFRQDLWPFLETERDAPELHLALAARSDRWSPDMRERAEAIPKAARVQVHTVPEAGHWVHADNPEGLLEILRLHFSE